MGGRRQGDHAPALDDGAAGTDTRRAKGERTGKEWLSYAHLLAIGMRQIERHLQFLKDVGFRNPAIADAATKFFDACNTAVVRDLRDLLEHQADYIAGEGRKPHLVVDLRQPVSFGGDSTLCGPLRPLKKHCARGGNRFKKVATR